MAVFRWTVEHEMRLVEAILVVVRAVLLSRARLAVENLALRQQLAVLRQSVKRPRLRRRDRIFWSSLSRIWHDWRSAIIIVKPETVIRWHRQGFRLYWRWKSRPKGGRPRLDGEIRTLIQRMCSENATWGCTADPSRARPPWIRSVSGNRREIHEAPHRSTIANVEDVP